MLHTMRWFGPNDSVPLSSIRQSGCVGVVSALHQIPVGELWTKSAILERKQIIEAENDRYSALTWRVVESLPVHEDIKKGLPTRDAYIENYKASLKNLADCGITTVCYNFMPVLDWSRTNVMHVLQDGSKTLRFDWKDFAVFDLLLLKRPTAKYDYSEELRKELIVRLQRMSKSEINTLMNTVLLGLPGSNEAFELDKLQYLLDGYKELSEAEFRENLYYFLRAIGPTAEELGVNLCIHPDDPPRSLLGLHRIVGSENDIQAIFDAYPHITNGLTFCTGSLGAGEHNDLVKIAELFKDRIHFAHLRATQREGDPLNFHEAPHLGGNVDMYEVVRVLVEEEERRKNEGRIDFQIPMRPDHGVQMMDDLVKLTYPGYSAIGRLKGLAELRGLEYGIIRNLKL